MALLFLAATILAGFAILCYSSSQNERESQAQYEAMPAEQRPEHAPVNNAPSGFAYFIALVVGLIGTILIMHTL